MHVEYLTYEVPMKLNNTPPPPKKKNQMVGWLVVLRIYVASAVFQPYRDLETGDNKNQIKSCGDGLTWLIWHRPLNFWLQNLHPSLVLYVVRKPIVLI